MDNRRVRDDDDHEARDPSLWTTLNEYVQHSEQPLERKEVHIRIAENEEFLARRRRARVRFRRELKGDAGPEDGDEGSILGTPESLYLRPLKGETLVGSPSPGLVGQRRASVETIDSAIFDEANGASEDRRAGGHGLAERWNANRIAEQHHDSLLIVHPAARINTIPQWMHFQLLRGDEEGLMVNETQDPISIFAASTGAEEFRSQLEVNFEGLLQSAPQDPYFSAPSARWEIPGDWLQTSLGDEAPRLHFEEPMGGFADGLIAAPSQTNDIKGSPSVTCNFGLMQQEGFGERRLEFYPETFGPVDAPFFKNRIASQAANTVDLMFLIITDWQPWFGKSLQDALPDFPMRTLAHFSAPQSSSMLPSIDYNEGELSCIMEHINTRRKSHDKYENEREIEVGSVKAQCLPLVVWTRAHGAINEYPDRPLIVVISRRTNTIASKVRAHYSDERYNRWDRISKNQAWVYLDLYFLFTKWDRVWGAVKHNLQKRTEEVHSRRTVLPILQQTRELHKDNNIMISLREHVRIHKASLKIVMQRVEYMLGGTDFLATQGLKGRLDDAYQLLEYYEVTAATLLEQQQNLLSLAFNLETVAQGQAVARLNALAFIFLPLSFVASVFGITTFTAPPVWYPVAAVPVLITTVIIAYAANKFFTSSGTEVSTAKVEMTEPINDLEKLPTNLSTLRWNFRGIFTKSKEQDEKENFIGIPYEDTDVNDPSRPLIRRSTDRSLAARNYVPPRSTVQYLPTAFDYSGSFTQSSMPSHLPAGVQSYDFASGSYAQASFNAYSPQELEQHPQSQASQYYGFEYSQSSTQYQTHEMPVEGHETSGTISQSVGTIAPTPRLLLPPLPAFDSITPHTFLLEAEDLEVRRAKALLTLAKIRSDVLDFEEGNVITVLSKIDTSAEWWVGRISTRTGIFPSSYVDVLEPEPVSFPPISHFNNEYQSEFGPYAPENFGLPPEQMASFLDFERGSSPIAIYRQGNSQTRRKSSFSTAHVDSEISRVSEEDGSPKISPIQPHTSGALNIALSGDSMDVSPYTPNSFGLPPEETRVSGTSDVEEGAPPPATRRHAGYYGLLDQVVSSGSGSGSGRLGTIAEEN